MVDRISFYKNMKILKLSIAKPIVIECRGVYEPLPGRDKVIQTSLPRNPSVAIQTDFDLTAGTRKDASAKGMERQSVLYVCHSDSDKETNIHSSMATQTNSDALSNCNSFEYLSGNEYDENFKTQNVVEPPDVNEIEVVPSTSKENEIVIPTNLRKCPPRSDLSTMTTPSSDVSIVTSKESSSTDLTFSKHYADLEKKLQCIKKVIKSKKYDSVAKKSYLKKIVQTMLDSKFSDESSGSIDVSKKSEVGEIIHKKKSSTTASDISDTVLKSEENKLNLHDNKPWLPVQLEDLCIKENQMSLKKLQTQTFTNDIFPENAKCPSDEIKSSSNNTTSNKKTKLQRNQLFTLTDGDTNLKDKLEGSENDKYDHGDSSNSATNDLYDSIHPTTSRTITPLISSANSLNSKDHSNGNRNIKDLQSWRENKTRSEELLEQNGLENKDRLVNFAKKEREQQLFWINNEISHLCKLKNLLENGPKSTNNETQIQDDVNKILQKPHVEDMKGLKKSTTLYVVTTEKSSGTSKCSTLGGCSKRTCRNSCCKGRYISPRGNSRSPSGSPNKHIQFSSEGSSKCKHSSSKQQSPTGSTSAPCPCQSQSRPVSDDNVINCCENGRIDLKNARLLSNEQYTTNTNDIKCRTSIRRYTFEIPIENIRSEPQILQPSCVERSNSRSKKPTSPCSPHNVGSDFEVTDRITLKKDACCGKGVTDRMPLKKDVCCGKEITDRITLRQDASCSNEAVAVACSTADYPCGSTEVKECCTNTNPTCTKESYTATTCSCKSDKPTQTKSCGKKDQATSSCMQRSSPPKVVISSSSESSSSSSETCFTLPSSTSQLCHCCRRRHSDYRRSSLQNDNTRYILCQPCYYNNQGKHYYTLPGHVCTCYNKPTDTIQQIRDTINQLEDLEREEEYCKCSYRKSHSSSGYCSKCGKLRNFLRRKKGGLAYIVTLESDENLKKKCKKKQPVLEEIKIKIPSPRSKCKKVKKVYSDCSKSGEESCKENTSTKSSEKYCKKQKCKKSHKPTLQEYLCANKPSFIASAEQRRQCLLDLAYMREQRCQKYKQLLALTSGIPCKSNTDRNKMCGKQHVFTVKEMKQMTAKHYKKLPEVQQKLEQNKEKQIRIANKLLADIFNQRLRQQVLRGKHTIPADTSIINLV
ncbi:hypothetical protein ILUMI_26152 [Ignelater luminosus]|uniref:ALMS motif domain-containing protein n=1 Tax=Ignelater luminosus TaxID=2038154 RepID=A0A8K0C749_IGNLU|nr:hypothetical protein ILUMI_26152 [Ignelater luminosus]